MRGRSPWPGSVAELNGLCSLRGAGAEGDDLPWRSRARARAAAPPAARRAIEEAIVGFVASLPLIQLGGPPVARVSLVAERTNSPRSKTATFY